MTQPSVLQGMLAMWASSHISGANAHVESLYEQYLTEPNAVAPEWQDYFDHLPRVEASSTALLDVPHSVVQEQFAKISKMRVRTEATVAHDSQATEYERKQVRVVQLISAYRRQNHQRANLDPLGVHVGEPIPDLNSGSINSVLQMPIPCFRWAICITETDDATLRDIVDALERTYYTIGVNAHCRHRAAALDYEPYESVRSAPEFTREQNPGVASADQSGGVGKPGFKVSRYQALRS